MTQIYKSIDLTYKGENFGRIFFSLSKDVSKLGRHEVFIHSFFGNLIMHVHGGFVKGVCNEFGGFWHLIIELRILRINLVLETCIQIWKLVT